jgi:hypothetical protein
MNFACLLFDAPRHVALFQNIEAETLQEATDIAAAFMSGDTPYIGFQLIQGGKILADRYAADAVAHRVDDGIAAGVETGLKIKP